MSDVERIESIRTYLRAHAWQQGHQRTAERFSVSRQTLWRFLERDQSSHALPGAVLDTVDYSVEALEAALEALFAENSSRRRPAPVDSLSDNLPDALLHLCEAPLTTAGELAQLIRVPVSTLRDQLDKLSERGLVDSRLHRLDVLGLRPRQRYFPTPAGLKALADDQREPQHLLRVYPVSKQWFKLLADRLDAVAVLYQVAAMIAELDPEQQPMRVDHYRQGP